VSPAERFPAVDHGFSTPRSSVKQNKSDPAGIQLKLSFLKPLGTKEKNMKITLMLVLIVFSVGCDSFKNTGAGSDTGTSMLGKWAIRGDLGSQGGPITYHLTLVSSPCTVTTPIGIFSVKGPVCFTANNNSGQGSIASLSRSTAQGVLLGVTSDPVPADAAFEMLFVAGDWKGNVVEFSGTGKVINGSMNGIGSCTINTPICQGISGKFSGEQE
jgi:hypothetical protein